MKKQDCCPHCGGSCYNCFGGDYVVQRFWCMGCGRAFIN